MDKELQQYAEIIEQLKPAISSPQFSQVLLQLTQDVPPEKRFLIKMELKRMAKPCMRSIDLRGQVDGECQLFEYNSRKHYLDDIAITEFKKQIKIFGHYCFGVYEAVMSTENNFRVMRNIAEKKGADEQRAASDTGKTVSLDQYTIPAVNLLSYAHRSHERMNFAIAVEVQDENHDSYQASSVDISMEGLRLKIAKEFQFSRDQRLYVYFRGLEDEFAMDKRNGIAYSVITSKFEKGHQYLILKRENQIPSPSFDKFLQKFIHGNKRRYKVNLANTIDAIINKTAELYVSPCSASLPVFLSETKDTLVPCYAMINSVNSETLAYWQDETAQITLGYLLKPARLQWLRANMQRFPEMYVYSFTHIQNGAVYFYSASAQELNHKEVLKNVYLGFGSRKVSWRVFKLTMSAMSPDQAYTPLSIPSDASSKAKKLNQPPSARLMGKLKSLRYIVHITDVTSESGQRQYARYKFNRNNLTHLRVFAHPRNKPPANIKPYRYRFQEQRMETRYLLRSPITLTNYNDELPVAGISEDISVSGLRLEIAGEFLGETGSLVKISFPKLQEMTDKYVVTGLIYEVIHYNDERNILHLRAAEGEAGKLAKNFFDHLIKQNKQSLKTYPEEEDVPGIGHALRCINARNTPNFAFLLAKSGVKYHPEMAVIGDRDTLLNRVASHYTDNGFVNVEFLFRDRNLETPLIQQGIKTMRVENMPIRQELYIAYDSSKQGSRLAVLPHLDNRFNNDESRKSFINDALSRGHFIAVQVLLTTTGKPDMDMLQAELNYVSTYALHKARELEEKIWSIATSVHLIDMTSEVLMRFGYDGSVIEKNRQPQSVSQAASQVQQLLDK
ncbi:PilZ domain-containing protein [Aestuariibacter sp. A3R04]|uniref:PilZ domain-containing protein n=1 Tax=Aestuariibacter sp. A3R04 TaxID=2841571 RepID=UPI001C0833B2|nr:PilZ domain-containing protein [Aestuariibacter sp. A3R04]MBU3021887.1 PilZ domain-containing protein [Aestuariibacter sp. A3R04]